MLLELLAQVLQEPFFDTLRTKEQLGRCLCFGMSSRNLCLLCIIITLNCMYVLALIGYIVGSGLKRSNGVQGIAFLVQSNKPANFVERRTEKFLHTAEVSSFMLDS